jgi:pilus assembly protein Flp/PilA
MHWLQWLFAQPRTLRSGQGLVEYALILMLIALVVFAVLAILGLQLSDQYENVADMF